MPPYPFEKLRARSRALRPHPSRRAICLSFGEKRHPQAGLIWMRRGIGERLRDIQWDVGAPTLREAIAAWLTRRHGLASIDPATQVLPVLGSREALFAFGQTVLDGSRPSATVVVPNPFYQIYEGAALLAGARIHCVNADPARAFAQTPSVTAEVGEHAMLYGARPTTRTGRVLDRAAWV